MNYWITSQNDNRSAIKENCLKETNNLFTLFIELGTVWTESFIMVPINVPALPRCDPATPTPDACHTNLQRDNPTNVFHNLKTSRKRACVGIFKVRTTHPSFPLLVLFWIIWSKTGSMIAVLTSFTLQQGLRENI